MIQLETKLRIFEEIDRICHDKPEKDRDNAKIFIELIESVPVVQMTNWGVCLVWKRICIVFEDGEIIYYRYKKDQKVTYEEVSLYEDCFESGILDLNGPFMEKCKEEVNRD